ncbi:uncharacterized protein DEA37_0000464 [Paragonimus westermani]|uniref:Uncharacterized protein n=1 Tax=Paragonimus westermani TaxID=34504 RepID=A0A5J4NST4_9TREM|nr:uncharacterized protein DEA37_0000464 [Paragonimus westermani]
MEEGQLDNDGPDETEKTATYPIREQRLNLKELEGFVFREITSDTTSSVSILGKRITRQYASEFVLPDDTRVAISRHESTTPSDGVESVTLCLSIGLLLNAQQLTQALATTEELGGTDSGAYTSISTASSEEIFSDVSHETDKETCSKSRGTRDDLSVLVIRHGPILLSRRSGLNFARTQFYSLPGCMIDFVPLLLKRAQIKSFHGQDYRLPSVINC